jgi:hypothetical protein
MAAGCHAARLALLRMPGRRGTHGLVRTTADAAGQMPGFRAKWQVGENAWAVIDDRYMRAARVGGTMITIGVTDLDDILARLAAHGI